MTRIERRIADLLKDGRAHPAMELRMLLYDGGAAAVRVHVSHLRRYGLAIVCERHAATTFYRLNLR